MKLKFKLNWLTLSVETVPDSPLTTREAVSGTWIDVSGTSEGLTTNTSINAELNQNIMFRFTVITSMWAFKNTHPEESFLTQSL